MKKAKLDIIYQDKDIIVINKPYGLLTISTDNGEEKTLFHDLYTYEKQKHKNNKVFIVHRLDRETSGLILFAKSEKAKNILQENWDEYAVTRGYVAVVEGKIENNEGTIKSWLKENKMFFSYSSNKPNDGKLAITNYKKILISKGFSLLDISIETGRKNQIRVHMQDINHPIIGDRKYGAKVNPLKRVALHAYKLEVMHPVSKEILTFETKIPQEFLNMFPKQKTNN